MIPVDLSASCEGRIYDPNGSGIQILGIRSRDPFLGSTDMSAPYTKIWVDDPAIRGEVSKKGAWQRSQTSK